MKIQTFIALIIGLFVIHAKSQTYQGLEKMCWTNDSGQIECYDESRDWYHLNSLYIDNDSVFLYKAPVIIDNNDTIFSASDGAFYYYYGILKNKLAFLTMYNCDYCARLVEIDSITGYDYPLPKIDTLHVEIIGEVLKIGNVDYHKIDNELKIFKNRGVFYMDSNSIYRHNPKGQYELISQGIKDFLKTKELKVENETLNIGLDRKYYNEYLETLDSSKIAVDSIGLNYRFLTQSRLVQIKDTTTKIFRYIEIGEIIDYWKAARITITYKVIFPKKHD